MKTLIRPLFKTTVSFKMDPYDSGYESEYEFDMEDVRQGELDDVPLDILLAGTGRQ